MRISHNIIKRSDLDKKNIIRDPRADSGYTLIEFAIAIIIIGLILGPAASLYALYSKNQRIEQTTFAVQQSANAVGGFSSIYGRYPCPARLDAVRGDADYGYEYADPTT